MKDLQVIDLFAGKRPDGQNVAEQLRVTKTENETYRLVNSPAFVKGLAAGDEIKFDEKDNSFELVSRAGNVCVRVFARQNIELIADALTGAVEKLGGERELLNERLMVFTVHVSCGFSALEDILNKHVGEQSQSAWVYGNVYDPADGTTPLNWWKDLGKEV